jgi:phosphatidylinositol glycan class B
MATFQTDRSVAKRPATQRRSVSSSLVPLLVLAFGIHILAAVVNEGFYESEEYYRYLEIAERAAGLGSTEDLPPAIKARTTPGLLPVLGHLLTRGADALGISSPFLQATLLRVLSSLLGLLGALLMFSSFRGECLSHAARRWLFMLLLLLWFIPSLQARFSPENWSGILFFLGLSWYYQKGEQGEASMMIAGFLLGLSFFARFQTAAMLVGFAGWLLVVERADRRVLISLLGGATIAGILGLLADRVFYGTWTLTPWNALWESLGSQSHTELASAGTPWWFTIGEVIRRGFYPIGALMVASAIIFFATARRHLLTWVIAPYLLLHILTPYPELHELFPLALALPVMLILAAQSALEAMPTREWRARLATTFRWAGYPLWGVNIVLVMGASLLPIDEYAPLYRFVYDRYGGGETILLHEGKDPYTQSGIPMVVYRPPLLQRLQLSAGTHLDSIVDAHPRSRIILASDREVFPAEFGAGTISFREVYRNVPEWRALANSWGWFRQADTILLHEVVRETRTPVSVASKGPLSAHEEPSSTHSSEILSRRDAAPPPAAPRGRPRQALE